MGKVKENQGNQNIAVYVRCRPLNTQEKKAASCSVVEANTERREVVIRERTIDKLQKTFTFDRVFDQNASQVDLYKVVVSPLLEEVLMGYSCTVFAYGQTGTGKTFTMEGERSCNRDISWEEDPQSGIVPRAMHHLFETLREQALDYSLRVSFLELYNEELFDLLGAIDDASKLRLYDDPIRKGSVIVQGIEEVAVHSKDEVYSILEKGAQKRQTAATLMNANSSRSHTVFSITVHIKDNNVEGEELMRTGKLNLVDLAGSENIGRSGAVDKRAREAGNINQSLLTLGRVITALVERSPHIPYRESKLTRLLQDSLGGKTKTSIIATISPASINIEETLSTLEYAHRAKNITNKPEANQKLTKKTLIKQYTEEIERLRRDLQAAREKNGIFLDPETYHQLTIISEKRSDEIEDLLAKIKVMSEERDKLNELFVNTQSQLEDKTNQLQITKLELKDTRNNLESTVNVLNKTAQDRDERNYLLKSCAKTERVLTEQASQLLNVANQSTDDVSKLHEKLAKKKDAEEYNDEHLSKFKQSTSQNLENMTLKLNEYNQRHTNFCCNLISSCDEQSKNRLSELQFNRKRFEEFSDELLNDFQLIHAMLSENKKIHSECTQNDIDAFKTFKEEQILAIAKTRIHQLVQLGLTNMDQQKQCLNDMKNMFNSKICKGVSDADTYFNNQTAQLESFRKEIEEHIELQQKSILSAETGIVNSRNIDAQMEKDLQIQIDNLQLQIENVKQTFSTYSKKRDSNYDQINQNLQNCRDGGVTVSSCVDSTILNVTSSRKDYTNNLNAWKQDFIHTSGESFNKCLQLNEEAKKLMVDIQQEAAEANRQTKEALELNYQQSEKRTLTNQELFNSKIDDLQMKIQDISTVVNDRTKAQVESINTQHKDYDIYIKKRLDETNEYQQKNVEDARLLSEFVEFQSNKLEIYSNNIRKDLPSGATPQRRVFSYPAVLAATSPYDNILQRYRTRMNEKFAINVPLPFDDSFDELSSSATSLESQVDNLTDTSPHNPTLSSAESLSSLASSDSSEKVDDEIKENFSGRKTKKDNALKKSKGKFVSNVPRVPKIPLKTKNVSSF